VKDRPSCRLMPQDGGGEGSPPRRLSYPSTPVPSSSRRTEGWIDPTVLDDSTKALVPSSPREGKRFCESRGAFHRQESHGLGIAPRGRAVDAVHYAAARRFFTTEGQPCNRKRQRLFLPHLPPGSDETSSGRGSEGRGQVLSLDSHGALRSALGSMGSVTSRELTQSLDIASRRNETVDLPAVSAVPNLSRIQRICLSRYLNLFFSIA
jgi:hypothetical protein